MKGCSDAAGFQSINGCDAKKQIKHTEGAIAYVLRSAGRLALLLQTAVEWHL